MSSTQRFKMDFLSSSSEDEKPRNMKRENDLEDSSSEEDIPVPKPRQNDYNRRIDDLSSAINSVKIKADVRLGANTIKNERYLEDSSSEEEDAPVPKMSRNHRNWRIDDLSSALNAVKIEEKVLPPIKRTILSTKVVDTHIKSERNLEDSLSLKDTTASKSRQNDYNMKMSDVSSGLSSVKVENKMPPPKHLTSTKLDTSMLDDSSDDDDDDDDDDNSILNFKSPFKSQFKPITLDDTDDSSLEKANEKKKSKGPWRFSISKKEYTVAKTSDSTVPDFRIPGHVFDKLYSHQKEGVAWMTGLHAAGIGGLLGDDMGMGKTYQTLTFLGGMMRARTIRNAIVVAPVSVLRSWEKEARIVVRACVPSVTIKVVTSDIGKRSKQQILRSALECHPTGPHLIITTYGLIGSSVDDFTHNSYAWDYVVLDEAHKIKNAATKVAKNIRWVARGEETRRLILTGTPIMNNLKELWALFDFVTSGQLLGPAMSFRTKFQQPIEDARSKDATKFQIQAGQKANEELQQKLRPYLLQRLKVDFMAGDLPTKSDFVVWTHISQTQRDMYETYVNAKDSAVADVLSGLKTSPLEAVTWLKKLCGHPILVSNDREKSAANFHPSELKRHSSKLQVLDALVDELRKNGHRMLIFSQSTKMLDIIQRVLERVRGLSRIDGSTKERDRQRLVDEFNLKGSPIEVMLLSTKAAGIGLTLTGADRAIIYDPSWNPAEDSQAVDRCYRIGQLKAVSVFRLIAAGTVEEKMYEKQVHKDGIRRAVVTNMGASLTRYFDKHDLKQIFNLNPAGQCDFLDRLGQRGRAGSESSVLFHREVVGMSSHDILYTEETIDVEEEDDTPQTQADSQENPFSSPTKAVQLTLHTPTESKSRGAEKKVLGKSQRALHKKICEKANEETSFRMLGDRTNLVAKNREPHRNGEPTGKGNEGAHATMEQFLKEADRLSSAGRKEDAMEILMNAIDKFYDSLQQPQKLLLHGRMSSIAYELRWL